MNKDKVQKVNYVGIIATIAVTFFFVWSIKMWVTKDDWPYPLSPRKMRANEIAAFNAMQQIVAAQSEYIKKDWDGDGKKNYSPFLVQLWRTISNDGEYLDLNLLNENIASAMGVTHPYKGYYYKDWRFREDENEQYNEIDYEKEWIISAAPYEYEKTGHISFVVDQSGNIYAKNTPYPSTYSIKLADNGYVLIKTEKELKELQKEIVLEKKD